MKKNIDLNDYVSLFMYMYVRICYFWLSGLVRYYFVYLRV